MRTITRIAVTWAVALPSACTPDAPGSEADRKAAVVSTVERGWNRGEVEAFSTAIADPVTFHYAGAPRSMSVDEMGAVVLRWREAFPDLAMEIEELIAEDEIVAARLTLSGTHEGPWRGVDPTGRRASMALMMFFRFEDGKIVELWESDDQLGFRRQLGITP